ncbi:GNAT family N-acetyltransferase [bacterium]|nr:MAG: GNAT family N-acetyltransferase [bacterium]
MDDAAGTVLRDARIGDAASIHALVRELAEYERLAHEHVGSVAALERHLFGPEPFARVVIAEHDGALAGFALYFFTYSTFLSQPKLYLEDLFVRPSFRRKGIGRRLLVELARRALARDCGRMEWAVLDWNVPSIAFYRRLGAVPMDDWTTFRVIGEALNRLAEPGSADPAS